MLSATKHLDLASEILRGVYPERSEWAQDDNQGGDLSTLLDARIYTCIQTLAIIRGVRIGNTLDCFQELFICNNKKWIMTC